MIYTLETLFETFFKNFKNYFFPYKIDLPNHSKTHHCFFTTKFNNSFNSDVDGLLDINREILEQFSLLTPISSKVLDYSLELSGSGSVNFQNTTTMKAKMIKY